MHNPAGSDPSLFRILPFHRVVQLFETCRLHFAPPASWADPFETKLKHPNATRIFAQCWCKKGVSDAMWRIYSPDSLGVRIRTTRPLLQATLASAAKQVNARILVKRVRYLPESELSNQLEAIADELYQSYSVRLACEPLFMKRRAFHHEAEVRAVAYVPQDSSTDLSQGLKVPCDPHTLVQSVLVDPRAPKEFVQAYRYYLREKLGFAGRVAQSALYAETEPLEVL